MKKINNWKKFNELKEETYRSAIKKFREIGHDRKASDAESHLHNMMSKQFGDEPFSFIITKEMKNGAVSNGMKTLHFTGKLIVFEHEMSFDMFMENDKQGISIAPYFNMTEVGEPEKTDMFSPFWIEYGYTGPKTTLMGPMNVEEGPWSDFLDEGGDQPVLFDNRKDANRFIKILKDTDSIREKLEKINVSWYNEEGRGGKEQQQKDINEYIEYYIETVNNLQPKLLFR